MKTLLYRIGAAFALSLVATACFSPEDQRPGLRLAGESVAIPADWSFTNDHKEISVEVQTPYFLPHSVTIWCGEVAGDLYLAAGGPAEKNWPGWVDDEPKVKLQIGESLYPVVLVPLVDEAEIAPVRAAFAKKYNLPDSGTGGTARYWRVAPRV